MIDEWTLTIPELTGDKPRRAYVYLPDSYESEPDRHYPVLYMFDGQNVFFDDEATFGKSWGLKDYMNATQTQLIIAAVECDDSADNGRLREYSPYTFIDPTFGKITGLGKTTMNWFISTFKPYVDSHYRTLPDRDNTFIGGSSMGGLMSLFAVLRYNNIFGRAAVLSPSLWTNPFKVEQIIKRATPAPNTVIYMDYGSKEMTKRRNMDKIYIKMADLLMRKRIFLTSRIVPYGTHCEANWERQIPFFMNTLLYR